jgi:hypothetical protein
VSEGVEEREGEEKREKKRERKNELVHESYQRLQEMKEEGAGIMPEQ